MTLFSDQDVLLWQIL